MERVPFDEARELQIIGEYKSISPRAPALPRYNSPITPRENMKLLLDGEKPLWMPSSADCFSFAPKIIPDNVARGLVIDADPLDIKDAGGEDFFGVHWDFVPQVGGSMVRPGSPKVPDINKWEDYIKFPDLDAYDWAGSAEKNRELLSRDRMNEVWIMNGLFERLISFMDFENAALAMVDEDQQDGVHRLFDALCVFYDDLIEKYQKYYNADAVYFHDDWGSQRAPFFSLNTVREMLVPYLSRVVESCHKRGMYFDFHSCGKNEMLVPAMIESGGDIWCPQPMNDYKMLLEKYGDRIIIGVQPEITFESTEEEIIAAINKFIDEYGKYDRVLCRFTIMAGTQRKAYELLYSRTRQAYNS